MALFCGMPSVPFCLARASVFLVTATVSAAGAPYPAVFGYQTSLKLNENASECKEEYATVCLLARFFLLSSKSLHNSVWDSKSKHLTSFVLPFRLFQEKIQRMSRR